MRDLVAITCTGDSSLVLFDDERGVVASVLGPDPAGPRLGRAISGMAVEAPYPAPGSARIFVASFDQSWVSAVQVDDLARPDLAAVVLAVDPAGTSGGVACTDASVCPAASCPGPACPATCPASCLVPRHIGMERK
jgi:hypothetical protein